MAAPGTLRVIAATLRSRWHYGGIGVDSTDDVVGRYRLEQRIGSGAMGVVWRATDTLLDRTVALKQLRDTADPADRQRLLKEAKAAVKVSHSEHVVAVHDVVDQDGPWLVMEFVGLPEPSPSPGPPSPSPTLADLIANGPLPPRRAARIGAQIAEALAEAHRLDVVHRDVKPHNVLFRRIEGPGTSDHAVVGDFGIARHADSTITDGGVSGTPAYMSPEVAGFGMALPASDVFGLGCTVHAAVTGAPPFGTHGPPLAVMRRVQACEIDVPAAAGPLRPVLEQLLRKEPGNRPTAEEAARLLWAVAEDAPAPPPTGPQRSGALRSRRMRVVAGSAALAVLLVAVSVIWGLPSDRGSPDAAALPPAAAAGAAPAPPPAVQPADMSDVDPCGLVDPAALRAFGTGRVERDWGFYSRCDLRVQPGAGGRMDVEIELGGPPGHQPGPARDVGVGRLFAASDEGEQCLRMLQLPDGNRVDVTAKEGGPGADRCGLADAAVQHAIDVLRHGGLPQRPDPFPPNSLARSDACQLADPSALTRIPGLDPTTAERGFAGWRCDWHGDEQGFGAKIVFERNGPFAADQGAITTIAGHEAQVRPSGYTDQGCAVTVRNGSPAAGDEVGEVVVVDVNGPPPPAEMCGIATELAAHVAGRMPAA